MANDISANPWKLDTPGASNIYISPVRISNLIWANYTLGSGQTLLLQDINGKDIVSMTTGTGTQTQPLASGFIGWVRGIKLPTLSSGEITIAIGAGK